MAALGSAYLTAGGGIPLNAPTSSLVIQGQRPGAAAGGAYYGTGAGNAALGPVAQGGTQAAGSQFYRNAPNTLSFNAISTGGAKPAASNGGGGNSTQTAAQQAAAAAAAQTASDSNLKLGQIADQEGLLKGYLGELGGTEQTGIDQINNDFNKTQSQANQAHGNRLADFETKTTDTTTAKQGALDHVDASARSLSNSVRQMIGRAGGSGSSAYQLAAPKAIADKASGERGDVLDTYGRNFRDLTTAKTREQEAYDQQLSDLAAQKLTKIGGVHQDVLTQQNDLKGQLADLARQRTAINGGDINAIRAAAAPYNSDIANNRATLQSLIKQYTTPYQLKPVDVQAPTLANYVTDNQTTAAPVTNTPQGVDPTGSLARYYRQDDTNSLY